MDLSETTLPKYIVKRLKEPLKRTERRITTVEELVEYKASDLLKRRWFGYGCVGHVRRALAGLGLNLKDDEGFNRKCIVPEIPGENLWEVNDELPPSKYDGEGNASHYKEGGLETIDIIEAKLTPEQYKGFLMGNALKYLTRIGKKEDDELDMKKALWYVKRLNGE